MENMIWALIIVTGAANVNVSTGYPNKAICEDAISIVKTGMTVIEKKSSDEADKVREARLDQEFLAANPPRPTIKQDEGKCGKVNKSGVTYFSGQYSCTIDEDTNTTSFNRNPWVTTTSIGIVDPDRAIKYAKCVLVDSSKK
jgi:hypothetical protein